MNNASILMKLAPAAPAAPAAAGAEQAPVAAGGFDQALAAAQAQAGIDDDVPVAEPVTLETVADMLLHGVAPAGEGCAGAALAGGDEIQAETEVDEDADSATAAAQGGAAAILAQMLAGSSPTARPENAPNPDAAAQAIVSQPVASPARGSGKAGARDAFATTGSSEDGGRADVADSGKGTDPLAAVMESAKADSMPTVATVLPEKSTELPAFANQQQQTPTQGASPAQAAVQAAASALRDAAPVAAPTVPVHATLREPVGTARWADELGNRLVMMSVRGQQQGSLTLSPEHLGPVEVQISMNRETANVWFGAQHADTRAALVEAMPRLRELLASSGLSLGQSGVSEQAPREHPARPQGLAGGGPSGIDANAAVESPAAAWRVWRPGLIDTYA